MTPDHALVVRDRDGYAVAILPTRSDQYDATQAEMARWQKRGRTVAREQRPIRARRMR